MPPPFKVILVGQWDELRAVLKTLPKTMQTAALGALEEEAEHLREAMVAGVASGAPGGFAFAPHSMLTSLLGGGGRILMRSRTLIWTIVVIREGNGFFVGVRGERANIANLLESGATYSRSLTPRQRAWLFASMRRGGVTPSPGVGAGMVRMPPRPFVGPVVAQQLGTGFAGMERIRGGFQKRMGGVFG